MRPVPKHGHRWDRYSNAPSVILVNRARAVLSMSLSEGII